MEPTPEQKDELFRLSYLLTNMYIPINLVRVDQRTGRLIILAGSELEIIVTKQGKVAYDEAEFQDDE
ncbi:DUF6888 family protein [Scytonema sp. NUACC26]|uniref:DUF6888 family protein n=1 Tax=Scytonema sp. NUACC26 TaxID=3140176 RepID=UPI0034DB918B